MRTLLLLLLAFFSAAPIAAEVGQWPYHAGNAGAQRYSPLAQIHAGNVAELEVIWRWSAQNYGPFPEYKYIATPLMIDGVLYVTAGLRRAVVAIDAITGETLWVYRFDEGTRTDSAPRRNSGRGVAYWSDGKGDARILVITPAYHLVALDAVNGRPLRKFGDDGVVDLRRGLGVEVDLETARIGSSSPPMIVGNVAIVGAALDVGMRPRSMHNVPGHIRGFDVRTGRQLWRFNTIPQAGEPGNETWEQESWRYTGNAAVWTTMSADLERGLVYLPIEAATSDIYGGHRPGDNLYSTSLVCLEAASGRKLWHYQIVHHDIWDWDNPAAPILMDLERNGQVIPAVAQLTKQAFTYVFDRRTGVPLWPIVETPVPQSDVPGERTAPTQPIPARPEAFDRQGVTESDLIDFTPALKAEALVAVEDLRLGAFFAPPSLADAADGTRGTLVLPGSVGGANWEGGSFDPHEQLLFVGSMTAPSVYGLAPDASSDVAYSMVGRVPDVQGLPLLKPPYGRITAIDMRTGSLRWTMANSDTPAEILEHPALAGLSIPRTGKPTRAPLLATATLLFAGEGWLGDPVLRAHDKNTGAIVASIDLPASVTGLPMTYAVDGRQFIVVAVGGSDVPGELVALALPD